MNNIGYKLAKEINSVSLKTKELINFPEDDFEDEIKKSIYEHAKYYHKAQNGIIRVSKYQFSDTTENKIRMLKKHEIQIIAVEKLFDYEESPNPQTTVWYMNFADHEPFTERDSSSWSFESLQVMQMPLLYKINRFLKANPQLNIDLLASYSEQSVLTGTPILFENIPQWVQAQIHEKELDPIPITKDKRNNILSMRAPVGGRGKYSTGFMFYLVATCIAGFGGIQKQGVKSKRFITELHTGNWGCGNFRNNKELIYLIQMYVASVMGLSKIYFHQPHKNAFSAALNKYNSIKEEINFLEFIYFLDEQNYHFE